MTDGTAEPVAVRESADAAPAQAAAGDHWLFVGDETLRWTQLVELTIRCYPDQSAAPTGSAANTSAGSERLHAAPTYQTSAPDELAEFDFSSGRDSLGTPRRTWVVWIWPSVCSTEAFAKQFDRCQRFLSSPPTPARCVVLAAGEFDDREKLWLHQIGVRGVVRQPVDLIRWVNESLRN